MSAVVLHTSHLYFPGNFLVSILGWTDLGVQVKENNTHFIGEFKPMTSGGWLASVLASKCASHSAAMAPVGHEL